MKKKYKAVIFDFGNVIIDIDLDKTFEAFARLSFKDKDKIKQIFEENEIFRRYETGMFEDDEFREIVRQSIGFPLNDPEIDEAWNALLLTVPEERITLLRNLRERVPVYLLSNTSAIHINACQQYFRKEHDIKDMSELFDGIFLSYKMGLWKPDPLIYLKVLEELDLTPGEVLFLDDNPHNVEAAIALGIDTIKVEPPAGATAYINYLDF